MGVFTVFWVFPTWPKSRGWPQKNRYFYQCGRYSFWVSKSESKFDIIRFFIKNNFDPRRSWKNIKYSKFSILRITENIGFFLCATYRLHIRMEEALNTPYWAPSTTKSPSLWLQKNRYLKYFFLLISKIGQITCKCKWTCFPQFLDFNPRWVKYG